MAGKKKKLKVRKATKVIDCDIDSLIPEDRHRIAYETWAKYDRPTMSTLCILIGYPATRQFDLSSWKDGTYRCECPWHLWIYLDAERNRLFELKESEIDFIEFQKQKSAVYEAINKSKANDMRLIQLLIDSLMPYVTGKKAVTEDGEVIIIPRFQPRTYGDIISAAEKLIKLKLLITGEATERHEIIPTQLTDKRVADLNIEEYDEYLAVQNQQFLELVSELDSKE
jgi:hypothetical protein